MLLATIRCTPPARLGLAAAALALMLAGPLPGASPANAQATNANATCTDPGPHDYPVAGGWFYTEEGRGCILNVGPARRRGYLVVDDGQASFWTEFRRYGGPDVLGYPISQRYQYPTASDGGYWYQGFERGILQWQPDTGRAELANVFEQFTEQGLDPQLESLGIPLPEPHADATFASDAERRMAWLTEPRFLARFFFDPVAAHSSDPLRAGQTTFTSQEEAWGSFGLPQSLPGQPFLVSGSGASRVSLSPLVHTFLAQRFQKGGMELFLEGAPNETYAPAGWTGNPPYLLDPTIVPGDGVKGCVALTAVGLLARTMGVNKLIPASAIEPLPVDPSPRPLVDSFIPGLAAGQLRLQFQLKGSAFGPGEEVSIHLVDARADPTLPLLPLIPDTAAATDQAGAWDAVMTARVGAYDLLVVGATSGKMYEGILDLSVPSAGITTLNTTACRDVSVPTQPIGPTTADGIPPVTTVGPSPTPSSAPARAHLTE